MKKGKVILIFGATLFFLVSCMNMSFYRPGVINELRESSLSLTPPSQEGVEKSYWKVEEGIFLYNFSHGSGTPVLVIHGGPGFPPYQPWKGLKEIDGYEFYYYHQRGCGNSTHPVDRFKSGDYYANMVELDSVV